MTAVEWLVEHLNLDETSPNYNQLIINKAKDMEKEQMEKTWVAGLYCETGDRQAFIDYYNENYKSQEDDKV
jgi:hypothetical protein